jgi:uncharacterized protein YndB with AHSA1/START domain
MPIKKDGTGKRWVEMEFLAPGTPEELWQAMATGPGYAAWFTRATIEERVGGALRFHFGADISTSGEVTFWDPPHRVGYIEKEWNGDAPPVATEITIASRGGGQCIVRMVHSLFASSDDWDDQLESFENGWPGFFEILRLYLQHFKGQQGASFQVMAKAEGDQRAAWSSLTDGLGLAGANVGDHRQMAATPDNLSGSVEHIHQDGRTRFIILRGEEPACIALAGTHGMGEGANVSISLFFYGDDAAKQAEASEGKWRDWLTARFGDAPVNPFC